MKTLDDLKAMDTEMLSCADISAIVTINAYNIHEQAIANPAALGFPVMVVGRQVRIPRRAFIKFMEGERYE